MKRIFALILILIILVVGAILLLPSFLSTDAVRNKVIAQLSEWTGKDIVLTGPAELSFFPSLALELQGLSVRDKQQNEAAPLVAMDQLTARINLLPLLGGNIEIDRFVMIRPRMELTIDAAGRSTWSFGPEEKAGGESAPQTGGSGVSAPVQSLQIGLMEIQDGQIRYRNLQNGSQFEATAINTKINWPKMSSPLVASGSLVWQGEVVQFSGEIADAIGFSSGGSSPTKLVLRASPVEASISGRASMAADLAMEGDLTLSAPSLRALVRWTGSDIPPGPGLGPLSLATHFTVGGTKVSLSKTKLTLDGNVAEGVVTFKMEEQRNYIQATLALATLNIDQYLSQPAASTQASAPASIPAATNEPRTDGAPAASNAGPASANGWSREPFDFSVLKFIDADLRLSAGRILAAGLDLGSGAVSANLQQGRMATELVEIQAYGGHVNGTIVINARDRIPSMTAKLNASEANLGPLLTDIADFTHLNGIGNLSIDLAASGSSQAELVQSLAGQVDAQVTNGAIIGVDVKKMLDAYQQKRFEAIFLGSGGGKTAFDFLEATYALNQGIARNDNLMIQAPTFEIAGKGTVNIVNETLDYRLRAALVRAGGEDGAPASKLFEIPLIVRGPWSRPQIIPDTAAMIEDSTQVQETINEVGDALQQGDLNAAREAVENSLKDGEKGVRSLLDGLLGQPQQ
ncbi:MAG: AsmA family protein, partial [Fimbriimonadaceae bacterium]|nr:AsmA family protein [Alphaproteobacteria bacterium]